MNDQPAVITIKQILEGLEIKKAQGNNFAASLLAGYEKYRNFTPGQLPYANKLAREALFSQTSARTGGESLGKDFNQIIEKFKTAKANGLKHPALRFSPQGFSAFKITAAPDAGKNPGFLYVKQPGEFGAYYGKISSSGEFFQGRDCTPNVLEFLRGLAANPVEFSARHGRETGQCCFCARGLTDGRSVRVGYGPICAAKWDLPWGEE